MLPVECVVRGYLSGSGWKDYQRTGRVSGVELPPGLRESEQPARADLHALDEGRGGPRRGDRPRARRPSSSGSAELAAQLRDVSIAVYSAVAEHALARGVILADTKFEFGFDADGVLTLGDEVCTPDSSRFWPADEYGPGRGQASFDKQYVRDWASGTGWDRRRRRRRSRTTWSAQTRERYVSAYELLAGEPFAAWLERAAP